jgi:hypothetical protein
VLVASATIDDTGYHPVDLDRNSRALDLGS